ncbi:MAG TPA: DNA polymerase IV [Amphiplicatus sp.]|nr:DNA polymerase IV [Amphiplicatus sp.]
MPSTQPTVNKEYSGFCRNCLRDVPKALSRCPACDSSRIARHPELFSLSIAHLDCDAFYAAIEKRDDPSLADRPVIVGGGTRGVVSTCCYIARTYGVRSAMPMFKALKACPDAVVIKPHIEKYVAAGREIRRMMGALTPLVEPLSIDEAFMDLTGTERVHGMAPAKALARLQLDIEREMGVTASIGLSHNKFLAKIASDLDKPRGFAVIGRAETKDFLARQPIRLIWGVGAAMADKLERDGLTMIGQLQTMDAGDLARRYGEMGLSLARLSRGEDMRRVTPHNATKSVSSETTFNVDIRDVDELEKILWSLCEKVSLRMKKEGFIGRVVTLKLKSDDFKTITRRQSLDRPSNLARTAFAVAAPLLKEAAPGSAWRLIGVGYSDLEKGAGPAEAELFAREDDRWAAQEKAIDQIREKFGKEAIAAGRALRPKHH